MKKSLSLLLAVLLVCTMIPSALAATITESNTQSGDAQVVYGVSESYIVTVPDSAVIDTNGVGSITISASNVMLSSGDTLNVYLTGNSYTSNAWYLTDTSDVNNKLAYTIKKGAATLAPNAVVLTVRAGEAWNNAVSQTLNLALNDEVTQAGVYTDQLTFVVECTGLRIHPVYNMYIDVPYIFTPTNALFDMAYVLHDNDTISWFETDDSLGEMEYKGTASIDTLGFEFPVLADPTRFVLNGEEAVAVFDTEYKPIANGTYAYISGNYETYVIINNDETIFAMREYYAEGYSTTAIKVADGKTWTWNALSDEWVEIGDAEYIDCNSLRLAYPNGQTIAFVSGMAHDGIWLSQNIYDEVAGRGWMQYQMLLTPYN